MPQWLINISPLLNLVAVLILLYLVYEYRFPLKRRLERTDERIARLEASVGYLGRLLLGLLDLTGNLIMAMHRQGALTQDEFQGIQQNYFELVRAGIDANLGRFTMPANPLDRADSDRLHSYIAMAERGEVFTPEQVEDYQTLMAKLEKEHPGDPGLWPLVALGAFLFGLYLGTKKREQQGGHH